MATSLKENECPYCGHVQPVRYEIGDPETCDKCGNITERKNLDGWIYNLLG